MYEEKEPVKPFGLQDEKKEADEHLKTVGSGQSELLYHDAAVDRRITRKFDTHVVPWLFGLWLLAFIDRSNIGNARIDGLATDLGLAKGNKYNIVLAIFYIPYILADVPSNLVMKHFGAGRYLPGLMTCWGIVGLCTGFTKNYAGILVCRFLLGLFEGGLLGGMVLYLSMFYQRHDMLFRIGLFYCAAPLSGAFGGLLATGLAEIKYGGYNRWPWIFIVEGIITVLFGILTVFFLPDTPSHAKFLTDEEKRIVVRRMHIDAHGTVQEETVDTETFSWHWVRLALLNTNTILLSLNFFAIITPIYSFSLFLPTINSGLGYNRVIAQLFTVPPNMAGFLMVLLGTFVSDRIKARGPVMIVGCSIAIIGYIMLLASTRPLVQWGGTFFVASGVFPSAPAVMGWLSNNLAPHYTRATGTGFQVGIANCAAFIATFTYLQKDAPRYIRGHSINIGMLVLSLILSTSTILYCRWENAKRAKGDRDHRLSEGEPGLLGHQHPTFRYTI